MHSSPTPSSSSHSFVVVRRRRDCNNSSLPPSPPPPGNPSSSVIAAIATLALRNLRRRCEERRRRSRRRRRGVPRPRRDDAGAGDSGSAATAAPAHRPTLRRRRNRDDLNDKRDAPPREARVRPPPRAGVYPEYERRVARGLQWQVRRGGSRVHRPPRTRRRSPTIRPPPLPFRASFAIVVVPTFSFSSPGRPSCRLRLPSCRRHRRRRCRIPLRHRPSRDPSLVAMPLRSNTAIVQK